MKKIKLNAAQVIKHMSEKELKDYEITLERKTDGPETIPPWFQEFLKEFRQFKSEMTEFKSEMTEFKSEMTEFKVYVTKKLDEHDKLFKEHKWIK